MHFWVYRFSRGLNREAYHSTNALNKDNTEGIVGLLIERIRRPRAHFHLSFCGVTLILHMRNNKQPPYNKFSCLRYAFLVIHLHDECISTSDNHTNHTGILPHPPQITPAIDSVTFRLSSLIISFVALQLQRLSQLPVRLLDQSSRFFF